MRYIDKSIMREDGEKIIDEFLRCFYNRRHAYPNDPYKAFCQEIDDEHGHVSFRNRLVNEVLMPEQEEMCCYCMRKLNNNQTLEHIMPNHAVDKAELDQYRNRHTQLDSIPHSNDFNSSSPIVFPPHPHSIAYQNLILSCDGKLFKETSKPVCCNLKRRHKFVPPFVLYDDISQHFEYTSNGFANWTEDPEPPESDANAMRVLGLNNFVLRMIRRIWFYCQDNSLDPFNTANHDIVNSMIGDLADTDITESEINMLLNFRKDNYWKLLLEYEAFADIPHR